MKKDIGKLEDLIRIEQLEVDILQAQLNVAKGRKERKRLRFETAERKRANHPNSYKNNKTDSSEKQRERISLHKKSSSRQGLLEILDALGSNKSDLHQDFQNNSSNWQEEDDVAFRLLPLLGGVCFTHVSHPTKKIVDSDASKNTSEGTQSDIKKYVYSYELHGCVLIGSYNFQINMSIATFETTREIDINGNQATVQKLDVKFQVKKEYEGNHLFFPHDEIKELSLIASRTKNITQMFRNIVNFSEFDLKRQTTLKDLMGSIPTSSSTRFRPTSACNFCLRSTREKNITSLKLEWKYLFSLFGRGTEELTLNEVIHEGSNSNDSHEVVNNQGLQALIHCYKGSCEKALKALIQSVLDNID